MTGLPLNALDRCIEALVTIFLASAEKNLRKVWLPRKAVSVHKVGVLLIFGAVPTNLESIAIFTHLTGYLFRD